MKSGQVVRDLKARVTGCSGICWSRQRILNESTQDEIKDDDVIQESDELFLIVEDHQQFLWTVYTHTRVYSQENIIPGEGAQRIVKRQIPLWPDPLEATMSPDLSMESLPQRYVVSLRLTYERDGYGSYMFGVGDFTAFGSSIFPLERKSLWMANVSSGVWICTDTERRVFPISKDPNLVPAHPYATLSSISGRVHTFMLDIDASGVAFLFVWRDGAFLGRCPVPVRTHHAGGIGRLRWTAKNINLTEGVEVVANPCLEPPT